jgi:hypothetical protein
MRGYLTNRVKGKEKKKTETREATGFAPSALPLSGEQTVAGCEKKENAPKQRPQRRDRLCRLLDSPAVVPWPAEVCELLTQSQENGI